VCGQINLIRREREREREREIERERKRVKEREFAPGGDEVDRKTK
jgi:hypothetical protein